MTTAAATQRYLTDEQIASYHRDGYLAVPRLIDAERVAALRRVTDGFVERSRAVTKSDTIYDLDPRHTAAAPVLRRIKNPADNDALYRWLSFESPIVDVVTELLGPSIRFHHSKLNLKGSHLGAPVEVHQDAAFYPHSNDDVLAVGLLLDDATVDNGPTTGNINVYQPPSVTSQPSPTTVCAGTMASFSSSPKRPCKYH